MIKAMAVVFLFSVWCTTFVTEVQGGVVYSKSGDVVVAALLPISRGPLCQKKRPEGILLAEAVIHSVSKNHSSALKGNYTLGYYIKDTCGDARIAVRAAFELVTTLKGLGENFSCDEIRGKIVAVVVVDGGNSSTQRYVKGILDAFDLPQILIGPNNFGVGKLREEIVQATTELSTALDHSRVAVLGSAVTDSLTILLESKLRSQGHCLVAGGAISIGAKQPGINPAEPAGVRAKLWQSIARVDLVIMLSSVEKSQEVLEEARQNGVENKTWVIVDEATRAFYAFDKTQPGDVILVMAKDNPAVFSELREFNRYLTSETAQLRPSKTRSRTCTFLSRWSRFIRDYPRNKRPSLASLVSSANRVADVLSKVSCLRLTLDGILCPRAAPCEAIFNVTSEKIAELRTRLKSSLTKDRFFEQPYFNATPSARAERNSEEFLLRRVRWSNAPGIRTFPRVGAWGNNCGWEINSSELNALKKRQEVVKCPSGQPVKLPPYWDNCRQFACLTCPRNNREPGWRNDSCRLCTDRKCSRIPIVYVSFSHPFALAVTCLCVLGEACVIFVVIVFAKYRKTPVVKSSNRTFNFFMLSTLGVWFAVTPMFLGRPGYLQCNTIVAAFLMLYATVSSILLSKTVRLLLIFKSMQQRPKWLGNASFCTTTIAFILIQALLCAMSYLVQPVQPEYAFHYDAVLLSCGRSSSPATALGFVYNCLLSGLCGFFAYKVRKLPQNFNEAKYISLGIFSYSLSWIIVLTGYYDKNCLAKQTTVICLGFAVGGLSVLGCLFSPKVLTILFFPQLNTRSVTVEAARRYSIEASVSLGGIRSSRTRSSTLELPCSSSARIDFSPTNDNFLGVATRPRTQSDCSISRLVAERRSRFPSACSTDVTGSMTPSSSESAVTNTP